MKIAGIVKLFVCFLAIGQPVFAARIYQRSLENFIQTFPGATCLKSIKGHTFNHASFPLHPEYSHFYPSSGEHPDMFIFQVPQGLAHFDKTGYVYINDSFIKETQIKDLNFFSGQEYIDQGISSKITKIRGRVAIVSHLYPYCYGHWIFDVLGQLAMLEIHNIEYDYLCVPYFTKFMQESLDIWGVDRSKIIPIVLGESIQADSIIMTTALSQDKPGFQTFSNYFVDFLLLYIQSKMISGVYSLPKISFNDSEKIFISRKDAGGKRAIPNENEIFELFKPYGFVRYELGNLSVAQQILLFNNAKTVVSFVGSGATNILFCKPGTHYVEITQKMVDSTFFFISDTCKLKYSFINDSTYLDIGNGVWAAPKLFPPWKIQEFINQNPDL